MAIYPSTLAWKILWTEEPGGLQFMGSQKNNINNPQLTTLMEQSQVRPGSLTGRGVTVEDIREGEHAWDHIQPRTVPTKCWSQKN